VSISFFVDGELSITNLGVKGCVKIPRWKLDRTLRGLEMRRVSNTNFAGITADYSDEL
jgi:hypothetical protein